MYVCMGVTACMCVCHRVLPGVLLTGVLLTGVLLTGFVVGT